MTFRIFAFLAAFVGIAAVATAGYLFRWVPSHSAGQLAAFTTDGCSNFPDGSVSQRYLWLHCCIIHDKAYWAGGTYADRLAADQELAACVSNVGKPEIARLMLAGVRVGGAPWWPTPYRWGYGWPYSHGYRALTPAEKQEAAKKFSEYEEHRNIP